MKIVILVTGLLSIGILSCTSNDKQPQKAESDTLTKTTVTTSDPLQKDVAPTVKEDILKENTLLKEEALGPLSIGGDMFYINKVLGPWDSESEAEIWEVEGMEHKSLTYEKGIVLDMVGKNENFTINSVKITSPSDLTTRKGIKIGSQISEVIAAYDKNIKRPISDSSKIVAGSVSGGLVFTINKGKVSSIFLGASAE